MTTPLSQPCPGTPTAPAGSPQKLIAANGFCCNCAQQCPISQMCAWGKTSMSCHICKTNYNRQNERIKSDGALERWWKNLSKEERMQWYIRNKNTYEPNKRKAFNNPGVYEESESSKAVASKHDVYRYLTMDDFIIRQRLLGLCGNGTPQEQHAVGKKLYEEKTLDRNHPKEKSKATGEWLIGVAKGMEARVGDEESREIKHKRQKTITVTVDHGAAEELKDEAAVAQARWLSERGAAASHSMPASHDLPDMQDGLARCPATINVPKDEFADELQRSVILDMRRQTAVANQEEIDDYEAKTADKIERSQGKAGRPKKLASQVAADVSKMIRDRQTHIQDAIDDLKRTSAEVVSEAEMEQKPLPSDLQTVADSMKSDVQKACDEMEKAKTRLGDPGPRHQTPGGPAVWRCGGMQEGPR